MATHSRPGFRLRQAVADDAPGINRLRLTVRENVLSDPSLITEAMTAEALTVTGRGWVAEDGGDLLGFSIALGEDRSVWALFVSPAHEGKGVGTALLDEAASWLFSLGRDPIRLSTDPGTRAEAFYRAHGWQASGTKRNGEVEFRLPYPG